MTFQVACEIEFCYGHRLMEYDGKCKNVHGHNGKAVILLEAEALDRRGMVVDFGDVKGEVKRRIDKHLDHCMLLRRDDPLVPILKEHGEPLFLMADNPTAENIAKTIYQWTAELGFPVVEVRLWETAHCCATYRPERRKER